MVIDAEGMEDIEQGGDEGKELQGDRVMALDTARASPATRCRDLRLGYDPAVPRPPVPPANRSILLEALHLDVPRPHPVSCSSLIWVHVLLHLP